MIHFDAHADTGDIEFGSLWGHGQPMRRLIESGALRGDRFLQVGLRGYWPGPETLYWMAAEKMRSYEMTEIVHRGLEDGTRRGTRRRRACSTRGSRRSRTSARAATSWRRSATPTTSRSRRLGLPGFNTIQDYAEYDTRVHHTNMDFYERVGLDALKQASVVLASFAYQAAMREGAFPRAAAAAATP